MLKMPGKVTDFYTGSHFQIPKFLNQALREASSEQEEPEPSQWLGDLRNVGELVFLFHR